MNFKALLRQKDKKLIMNALKIAYAKTVCRRKKIDIPFCSNINVNMEVNM